jgi:Mg2+ and Co2+ transporter CorA
VRSTSTRDAPAVTASDVNDERIRARRFDADRTDQILSLDAALTSHPTKRQLLWIDITGDMTPDEAARFGDAFALEPRTRAALEKMEETPDFGIQGDYMHVRVAAEPDAAKPDGTPWLDIVAGKNVVISHHQARIGFLGSIDERIEADATFGTLSAGTFLAALLDAAITSYHRAVDAIEDDVDELDTKSLIDPGPDLLGDLVRVRRRIARLRRLLVNHRELFASLAALEAGMVAGDPESAAAFKAVNTRFDGAVAAVEDSREVLLGSFEVYMTRTAQRTNDVVKVLTFATILLLPGSLVAGLLGMNVVVPLGKDDPLSFWIVVAGVIVFGAAILLVARARRWR